MIWQDVNPIPPATIDITDTLLNFILLKIYNSVKKSDIINILW